ncbi:MAG: aspartate aminotransferase family protein [Chloroflexi bacterium HGW-Chloroflexi-4]|nr:MAG: aspartate aminotransferase family protein [Chloroflexi bacterium HGW-Chloroflexi-4]
MIKLASDRAVFNQAKDYALDYLDGIFEREVYPNDIALQNLKHFDEPMPIDADDPASMLKLLHDYGSPATVATTGGRYFGLVVGGSFAPVLAVKWLADVWDQLAPLYVTSPIMAKLETVSEQWMNDLLGLPKDCAMGLVSGTSMATMVGFAAARYELLRRADWDVNTKGLFGAPPIRVVVGAEAHSSVFKALAILGLGKDRVELVPVDEQGRMRADKVPALDDNTLLILQAGNVNSGSFDPIDEICDMANKAGAWVHVDGAFGLWAAASKNKQYLTMGMEKADSWSVDGHKTLNTPYDCGIVICRDRNAMITAMQASGDYILYSDQRDGMLYSPDMSRRGRAVELWATLKLLGKSGVEELVDGLCDRACQFATDITTEGFNVLNDVVFNQVLVTCGSPEETAATLRNLQRSGECWCGSGKWHEMPVIRVSVCSWATTEEDISRTVRAFVKARRDSCKG